MWQYSIKEFLFVGLGKVFFEDIYEINFVMEIYFQMLRCFFKRLFNIVDDYFFRRGLVVVVGVFFISFFFKVFEMYVFRVDICCVYYFLIFSNKIVQEFFLGVMVLGVIRVIS